MSYNIKESKCKCEDLGDVQVALVYLPLILLAS